MRAVDRIVVLLVAVSLLVVAGCGGGEASQNWSASSNPTLAVSDGELTIAIGGIVTAEPAFQYYKGLAEYVGKKAGRPVRVIHKTDYAEVNQMLKDGRVDVAFMGAGAYVSGHDEFGLELVVAPVVNGRPSFCSYIIVPRSSPATSLASLKGKTFAFTDPESSTGHIWPEYVLLTMGTTSEKFFKETYFTYGFDSSIKAVATGEADGAAVSSLTYDYLRATDSTYAAITRVVAKSEEFAIQPVAARRGLDPAVVAKIRAAFLGADTDSEGKALLDKMRIEKFIVIEDSAYDSIRRMNEQVARQ